MENKIYQLSAIVLLFLSIFIGWEYMSLRDNINEDKSVVKDLQHFKDSVLTTDDQFYLRFERNYKKHTKRELRAQ